jgi:hypothetical protein
LGDATPSAASVFMGFIPIKSGYKTPEAAPPQMFEILQKVPARQRMP